MKKQKKHKPKASRKAQRVASGSSLRPESRPQGSSPNKKSPKRKQPSSIYDPTLHWRSPAIIALIGLFSRSPVPNPYVRKRQGPSIARTAVAAYSTEDRQALGLLMLPFLVFAVAIATSHSTRWRSAASQQAAIPAPAVAPVKPLEPGVPVIVAETPKPALPAASAPTAWPVVSAPPAVAITATPESVRAASSPQSRPSDSEIALQPTAAAPAADVTPVAPAATAASAAPAPSEAQSAPSTWPVVETSRTLELAALSHDLGPPMPGPSVTSPQTSEDRATSCVAPKSQASVPDPVRIAALGGAAGGNYVDPIVFGMQLAAAAREQLDDFTVYTDKYQTMKYPNGDLPTFYGVCTDVIVRAYRVLGIDLQALVHQSKVGSGDTNIDHRRVSTLQRFFAAFGESIPITEFSEDYWPGDIVSYYRPQNAHSRTHIAIVSDVVGPSGNFMIIHNRGWGPQQEDGLFVDQITGHYRYSGVRRPQVGSKSVPTVRQSKPIANASDARPIKRSLKAIKAGERAELTAGGSAQ